MKKLSNRISFEKTNKDELKIEIYPSLEKSKLLGLQLWTAMFTLCGLLVLSSFAFYDYQKKEEYLMVGIFLVFWGYFEFKVVQALQWNKNGKEVVEIKDGKFSYMKMFSKRGLPTETPISKMYPFKYAEDTESGIWNDINKSSFMIGGEVVEYTADGSIRRLGMKLDKKDAVKLVDLLNKTAGFRDA